MIDMGDSLGSVHARPSEHLDEEGEEGGKEMMKRKTGPIHEK